MEHSFDINIAKQYGIHAAILLKNLYFWIEKNRANEKHFHDGRYWTYNSKKAFSELFPYLTERQVKYTLEKMKKDDLILVGNYNQDSYDKTNWYALTDKALKLLGYTEKMAEKPETIERTKLSNRMDKSAPIDWTKLSNGADNIVQPIPDNKPDNKQTNNNGKTKKEIDFVCTDKKEQTKKEEPKTEPVLLYKEIVKEAAELIDNLRGTNFKNAPNYVAIRNVRDLIDMGYMKKDFMDVVRYALANWNAKAKDNISPQLLFRPDKFGYYLDIVRDIESKQIRKQNYEERKKKPKFGDFEGRSYKLDEYEKETTENFEDYLASWSDKL